MNTYFTKFRSAFRLIESVFLPVLIIVCAVAVSASFFFEGKELMAAELRERIRSLSQASALLFDAEDIEKIRVPDDAHKQEYANMIRLMNIIRSNNSDVRFVYLLRETSDPNVFSFVADADSLNPFPPYDDLNGDGITNEDDERVAPGTPYDVSEIPDFHHALTHTETLLQPYSDQWGTYISSFSPVFDEDGKVVAVLGVDVDTARFEELSERIFSTIAVLLTVLVGSALALTVALLMRRHRITTLQELNEQRSALLDLATHQLGMPLATFRWWLELLGERNSTSQSPEDREVYEQLQLGVDRMDHIVRSLFDAARLQGDVPYHAESMDPVAFVREVIASMQSAFHLKKQRVELVAEGVLPHALIDRKLLFGVLAELLENARGYSPAGSKVTVRVHREKSSVHIDVIDHGCGIPADELPRIFHKFTRGKNAYVYKPVGNGLGLYICKGIVERGGGKLLVSSKEGEGTVMTLELPMAA